MSDVDLLHRAAAKARETAQPYNPSQSELANRLDELGLNPRLPANQAMATQMLQREQTSQPRDGKFMLAVAWWLDQHAAEHDVYDCEREDDSCAALAVARALLNNPKEN